MRETSSPSPFIRRTSRRRQIDFEIMVHWIEENSRVLDLGCGRGVLLEELQEKKNARVVGVDADPAKVASCIRRGVSVFQGDVSAMLSQFEEDSFDYVVFSRTLEMISEPGAVIHEALRIGRSVLVGTINRGYWKNRFQFLLRGRGVRNDVYPLTWEESPLTNHLSVGELLGFVEDSGLAIKRSVYLRGDWKKHCKVAASWRAGYAIFEITRRAGCSGKV